MFRSLSRRLRWVAEGRSGAAAVAQTALARGGALFGNVATGVIVARSLHPIGRGEQAAMSLWPMLFSSLFTLGLPLALIYNVRHKREKERAFFSAAILSSIVLGILAGCVGATCLPFLMHAYSPSVVRAAQVLMVFAPQPLIQYNLQAMLEARGRFSLSNRLRYVPLVLTLLGLAVLAVLHRLTPFNASLCYAIPPSVLTITTFWQLRDLLPLQVREFSNSFPPLIRYGIQAYGVDVVNTLAVQIEQGLLVGLLTPAQLGVYTVGLSVSRVLNVVHSSFVIVLLPKAAARHVDDVIDITSRAVRVSTAMTVVGAVLIAFIAPVLLPVLYGKSFAAATTVARILVMEVVISGMISVLVQSFMALGKPGLTTLFQIAGVALSAPLLLILVPRFGLVGAALAFVAATTFRLGFVLLSYPVLLHRGIPRLILTRDDIAFVRGRLASRGASPGPPTE